MAVEGTDLVATNALVLIASHLPPDQFDPPADDRERALSDIMKLTELLGGQRRSGHARGKQRRGEDYRSFPHHGAIMRQSARSDQAPCARRFLSAREQL